MNKNRKTSHILNVFQYDETTGAVTLPSTLVLTAPASNDNSTKVGTTAWVRTYVTGLSYLTGNQSITISGDATGSGTTAITLTLANTAVTPGTYGSASLVPVVTVDSKGRITSVTTAAISGSLTFTGDVTGTGTTGTSTGLTLAASGVTAGTYTKVTVDTKGRVTVGASATTSDISEGTNLYYTDARVLSYLTANTYATQSYVSTQVANLVAAAPATLDTLNELAAALGNDPSFATTVSTSIGTKVPQTRTLTINGTAYDLSADRAWTITSMIYPSAGIAVSTGSAWGTSITDNSANWNTAFGWGNHASAGYLTSATAASTYASLTGAYANPAFVASLAYSKITGVPAFLTSYTETDPYRVTSVAVSGTSTKTITLTRADASTVTTTWTDIDTDTNTYVTSAGFSGGTLTLTRNDAGTVTVSLDGRYYLATNPSSYITSSSLTSYVPYTGATANIDTGGYSITAGAVTLTSNLWLKNIGTYDFIMSNGTSITTNTIRAYYNTSDELRFYAKNTAGSAAVPKLMVGDGTTFYTIYHTGNLPTIPTNNNQLTNGAGYITGVTNISGNAGTVTNATFYRQFTVRDDRSDGSDYSLAARATGLYAISSAGTNGPGHGYLSLIHVANGTDVAFQIAGGYNSDAMYFRGTTALQNGTGYSAWRTVVHSGNIGSYAVTSLTDTLATVTARGASTLTSITAADFYTAGWFRNSTALNGLYNSAYDTHFYASGTGQWNFATSNNSWIQIALRPANHQSTVRGYLYADTSNNVGLLTYDGNWGFRVDASKNVQIYGTDLTVGNSTSSNIYMTDTDETTRRIHCNSGRIGFLNSSNGWGAYCDNSGNWFANNLSGTNTGDQTNISGNAATATSASYLTGGDSSAYMILLNANTGDLNTYNTPGLYSSEYVGTTNRPIESNGHWIQISDAGGTDVKTQWYYQSNGAGIYMRLQWGNGTWRAWRTLITDSNIGSQSVSYASTAGNAATATTAPSGTNRGDQIHGSAGITPAQSFGSMPSAMSGFTDNWGGGDLPSGMSHVHGIACRHFNNSSNYWGWHMVGQYDQPGDLRVRWVNAGSWTGYYQLVTTSNIGSQKADGAMKLWAESHPSDYYVRVNWTGSHWYITSNHPSPVRVGYADTAGSAPANGGTSSNTNSISNAVGTAFTWTGIQQFQTNNGGSAVNNSNTAALQAFSTGNNTAFMSFHRGGYYATNFGLDNDNVMRIGGWSASPNRLQLDMSGNLTLAGDVTAYSDARVKENIATIENALSKVLALRGVSYNRIDSDDKKTKIGVIAQETLTVVPEVVNQDNDGMYNVSYGNLAGLFIEAIKEQQKEIEELKTLIYGITR